MPQITLTDVAKQYPGGKYAVEHLDLELPDGSFTVILGPSGCGKTTTLRMVAGLERPTAGEIRVGDRLFSSAQRGVFIPPNRRDLGLVFQSYALWPHLTVAENIEFGLTIKKMARAERRKRITEMLELLHVEHLAQRIPSQLSGGEQQRIAIARALAPSPALVMFDEPLSNLDAPLRLELSAELKRLHHEVGMTALFVTHDQAEAMAVATELIVMREGHVEQQGPPTEVYGSPASVHVARFVGSPPMNLLTADGAFAALCDEATRSRGLVTESIAHLGARPEHVLLGPDRPGWRLQGRVESTMSVGASAIVRFKTEDGRVVAALVPGDFHFAPGSNIEASIELERVHLFDQSGVRAGGPPGALDLRANPVLAGQPS